MSNLCPSARGIGVDDYLQGELHSETRHEYIGGQVYAMVGASRRQGLIAGNLFARLRQAVSHRPCQCSWPT